MPSADYPFGIKLRSPVQELLLKVIVDVVRREDKSLVRDSGSERDVFTVL